MNDFYTFWGEFLQDLWSLKIWGFLHFEALMQVIFVIWIIGVVWALVSGAIERRL